MGVNSISEGRKMWEKAAGILRLVSYYLFSSAIWNLEYWNIAYAIFCVSIARLVDKTHEKDQKILTRWRDGLEYPPIEPK